MWHSEKTQRFLATHITTHKFLTPKFDASGIVNRVTKRHTPEWVVVDRKHTLVE